MRSATRRRGLSGVLAGLFACTSAFALTFGLEATQPPAAAQAPAAPPAGWSVWTPDGRQPLSTTVVNGRDMVTLEELSRFFGLDVREDAVTRGLSIAVQGRTIVVSGGQGLASIGGRVVTMSTPPQPSGSTWLVPMDFVDRVLALVYQPRIEVRPRSRLVLVGDVRVPRVAVRVEQQAGQARVTFDTTPPTAHTVVQEPGRLVVRYDAQAVDLDIGPLTPSDVVLALRSLGSPPGVAIELGPRFATFKASDLAAEAAGQRLVIDLVAAAESVLPTAPPTTAPAPPLLPESTGPALRTIVLDPGHGGEEEGAKGPGGALEKQVCLVVARQLKAVLEARLGVRVLMTREDDRTVKRDERAAFANNNKADLFLSLHTNASVGRSAAGAEVYYLSLDGYSPEAQRLAMREGGAVLPTVTGGDRQIEIILWEMAQVQHVATSAAFARLVEESLRSRVKMRAGAIQQAPFSVLVGANMPAILVEMGFISNAAEEKLLSSSAHQQIIVEALAEAVARFRDMLDAQRRGDPGTAVAPRAPASGSPARTP